MQNRQRNKLYDWCFAPLYEPQLRRLSEQLSPEKWSFEGKEDYGILRQYILYTFDKLKCDQDQADEHKKMEYIYEGTDKACFHTGLFDKNWQPIYFCCEVNNKGRRTKWKFSSFCNSYTISYTGIPANAAVALRRADYFADPSALIYNTHLQIFPQWNHILDDEKNYLRIPSELRELGKDVCRNVINGAIEKAKIRIDANYHTAVPQWYQGRIQLLVPLYLTNEVKPDLALVLSLSDDKSQYWGHTCLTTEMAYSNARLIAKPESFWLHP